MNNIIRMVDPKKKLKGKTVLVTGGAGFIGSHLVDHLLKYGANVICLDNLSTGKKDHLITHRNEGNFLFVKGDVNAYKDLAEVFKRFVIDYVFHYAALVGVKRTVEDPLKVLEDIEGIKNILELSRKYKVKKIVYASSSEVYGNQEKMPLHEDHSYLDIRLPYAMVKSVGENYFRTYWEVEGIPVTILRFFNVYGPRQESTPYGFVVGIFISQVLAHKRPTIFYDGTHTRDFMYVAGNIEASIQALINSKANGHAINIGTGVETTILDLAQKIIAFNKNGITPSLLHKRKLSVEVKRRVADTGKLKTLLGFTPQYSLGEGLRLTYNWYADYPKNIKRGKQLSFPLYRKQIWIPRRG